VLYAESFSCIYVIDLQGRCIDIFDRNFLNNTFVMVDAMDKRDSIIQFITLVDATFTTMS
jgi:hypothetical protein